VNCIRKPEERVDNGAETATAIIWIETIEQANRRVNEPMRIPGYTLIFKRFLYPLYNRFIGRDAHAYFRARLSSQLYLANEIKAIQFRKLKAVLVNASKNVPFYRSRFQALGFDPNNLRSLEEFDNLDFYITKADVRANPDAFIAEGCDRSKLHWHRTGGSTGEPLYFPTDPATDAASAAAQIGALHWWGIEIGERHAMLWGSPTFIIRSPIDYLKKAGNSLRNHLMNRLYISNYNLSVENISEYRSKLEAFGPEYIKGMPSSLYVFAKTVLENDGPLERGSPRVVQSACEQLFDWQKPVIEKGFGAPVINTYGVSELGEVAFEAPCGSLHLMDEDIYIELKDFGIGENEIVATQLNNFMSPLIRYRTGDIADEVGDCDCDLGLRAIIGLKGRAHDFIIAPDGRYLHGQLFTHLIVFEQGVVNYQVRQPSRDEVTVTMVTDSNYSRASEDRLRSGIGKYMGADVSVDFNYVSSIPLTESGKHRWIISDVISSMSDAPC